MHAYFQTVARKPWAHRPLACKATLHTFDPISDLDVAAASQVCTRCGTISRHSAGFMIECIKRRTYLVVREYA